MAKHIISENQNKSSYSVEIVFQNSSEVFYIIDGDNIEDLYTFAKTNNITISGNVSNSSLHITIITILPFLIILLAYLIFILIVILTPFKDKKSKFILILLSVFLPIIGFIIFLIFSKKYNK